MAAVTRTSRSELAVLWRRLIAEFLGGLILVIFALARSGHGGQRSCGAGRIGSGPDRPLTS